VSFQQGEDGDAKWSIGKRKQESGVEKKRQDGKKQKKTLWEGKSNLGGKRTKMRTWGKQRIKERARIQVGSHFTGTTHDTEQS